MTADNNRQLDVL